SSITTPEGVRSSGMEPSPCGLSHLRRELHHRNCRPHRVVSSPAIATPDERRPIGSIAAKHELSQRRRPNLSQLKDYQRHYPKGDRRSQPGPLNDAPP